MLTVIHYWNSAIYFLESIPERLINVAPKPKDYVWSKYDPIFRHTFRLEGGTWSSNGQLWRCRRPDGKWEYRQDAETREEQLDRVI